MSFHTDYNIHWLLYMMATKYTSAKCPTCLCVLVALHELNWKLLTNIAEGTDFAS